MRILFVVAAICLLAANPSQADDLPVSVQLEHDLQSLSWPQFRAVVEGVPKLKADVDAFGTLGWEYVRLHYTTYRWQRNIERLDADQRGRLTVAIREAKGQD